MTPDPSDSGRRRFLTACGGATLAVGLPLGLAGCLGSESDDPDAEASPPDPEPIVEPEFASHPGDGPATIPEGHSCDSVCRMSVTDFSEWSAQLAHDDGTGAFFCSAGCLISYLVAPDWVEANTTDTVGVWMRDFETNEWIDGQTAYYALEHDVDRTHEPMGVNPRPFENREDAEAYVEQYDDLDAADIITLSEFDLETAHIYRANRLPALE